MRIENLPTLASLGGNPGALTGLPLDVIDALLVKIKAQADEATAAKKAIATHLETRFATEVEAAFKAQAKDFGTVHVLSEGYDYEFTRGKEVEWDQDKLAANVKLIRDGGDDPSQYVETTLSVKEAKFTNWPDWLTTRFAPARTVKAKSPSFKLSVAK